MNVNLLTTPIRRVSLTTDSPNSRYGLPVLDVDGADYGPSETVPVYAMTAADVVVFLARNRVLDEDEVQAVERFLRQWPEGPQI